MLRASTVHVHDNLSIFGFHLQIFWLRLTSLPYQCPVLYPRLCRLGFFFVDILKYLRVLCMVDDGRSFCISFVLSSPLVDMEFLLLAVFISIMPIGSNIPLLTYVPAVCTALNCFRIERVSSRKKHVPFQPCYYTISKLLTYVVHQKSDKHGDIFVKKDQTKKAIYKYRVQIAQEEK